MRFLADENMDADVVERLRRQGHDVLYVIESMRGRDDDDVLRAADAERRILITQDKDFGELVFRRRLVSSGVMLLRLETTDADAIASRLDQCWSVIERSAADAFIVIDDRRIRVRQLPK